LVWTSTIVLSASLGLDGWSNLILRLFRTGLERKINGGPLLALTSLTIIISILRRNYEAIWVDSDTGRHVFKGVAPYVVHCCTASHHWTCLAILERLSFSGFLGLMDLLGWTSRPLDGRYQLDLWLDGLSAVETSLLICSRAKVRPESLFSVVF